MIVVLITQEFAGKDSPWKIITILNCNKHLSESFALKICLSITY